MRSLRGTVPFVVLLFIVVVAAANGCSPVKKPVPTPDIAATVEAAVAAALASKPTPDIAATAEAVAATAMASQPTPDVAATAEAAVAAALTTQPTPDIAATVKVAVATEIAAAQTDQEPTVVESDTVALITCRDHFVIIDAGMLRANADPDKRDEKERFALLHLNNDKVAFRTSDGSFVTATKGEPWKLMAEETQELDEEQQFTLLDLGNGEVAIRTFCDRYVTAMDDQPGWNWELRAETSGVSDWERFKLFPLPE